MATVMWLNAQINGVRKSYLVDVLCKAMVNTRRWEYLHGVLSPALLSRASFQPFPLLPFVFSRAHIDILHLYFKNAIILFKNS